MNDSSLRKHITWLLREGHAHLTFDQAVARLPANLRGAKVKGVPHTPWRLLEHLRICQWDILEYCRNRDHISPEFPDGYWPKGDAPPNARAWSESVKAFKADLQAMIDLVANPKTDLFATIPGSDGHTILREALLIADHNAYHLGQLVMLRRALGAWKE